jgi:hypothetical protein
MTPLNSIKQLYCYLTYNPQVGVLSAFTSYVIALKCILVTDDTLKLIAAISSFAGCIVGCATALSWVIRIAFALRKFIKQLRSK